MIPRAMWMSSIALVGVVGVVPGTVSAQALLSIADGFESTTINNWISVQTPDAGLSANWVPSAGNPGSFAQLIAATAPNHSTGVGYQYRGPGSAIVLGTLGAQIALGADLKLTTTLPQTPIPGFVPFILQGSRLYQPATFIAAPTVNQWTTIAPVTFDVSEFTNSSGIPLDPASSVTVGFWLRMPAAPDGSGGYGVGVDNLSLVVIPAPVSVASLVMGVIALGARRR